MNQQLVPNKNMSMGGVLIFSAIFAITFIFGCCGSCIGCQAYRLTLIKNMVIGETQEHHESSQEGFVRMNDEP